MERLTFEGLFCDIAMCQNTPGGTFCETGMCSQRKVWERLKEWEDTGLDLEKLQNNEDIDFFRIIELLEADAKGRLVVLPVKVGDVIYKPVHSTDGYGVWQIKVGYISRSWYEDGTETDDIIGCVLPDNGGAVVHAAEFGKTVFLTLGEAEVALKGGAG